jgi:hypothetical protein
MTQKNLLNVIGDVDNFIDRLINHANEDDCKLTINDLLTELFDISNLDLNRHVMTANEPHRQST